MSKRWLRVRRKDRTSGPEWAPRGETRCGKSFEGASRTCDTNGASFMFVL